MAVGIPEVYALATQIPRALLLDSDSVLLKPHFPSRQLGSRNREGYVEFAISITRGRDTQRTALLKQQQDLTFASLHSTTALPKVADHAKTENPLIEARRC